MNVAWPLELTAQQEKVVFDDHRFALWIAGRRGGKSWALLNRLLLQAWARGGLAWYVAQYRNAAERHRWPDLLRIAGTLPKELQRLTKIRTGDLRVDFPGGAAVAMYGADNAAALHGGECVALGIDEIALIDPQLYEVTLAPATVRLSAPVTMCSTPSDGGPHLQRIYRSALDDATGEWAVHRWSTLEGAIVPATEIAREKAARNARTFRQQYEASFEPLAGRVWPEFSRNTHVVAAVPSASAGEVVIGVDWGWQHPGVMLAIAADAVGDFLVVEEQVHQEMPVTTDGWLRIARDLDARYPGAWWRPDPAMPAYIALLRRALKTGKVITDPVPRESDSTVMAGVTTIAKLLHVDPRRNVPRLRFHASCRQTIDQVEGYAWDEKTKGDSERPAKVDDDTCDALRYALHGHESRFKRQSW